MQALTLFYFKVEAKTLDELAKYWSYIEILEKNHILPIAQVPLELK
jgi:hypothetical protein